MQTKTKWLLRLAPLALAGALAAPGQAATCVGTCGVLAPNGVVTASPLGGAYQYISTDGGVDGAGQLDVGGTNGSEFVSTSFVANVGSSLEFYFNYVTSDGAGFSDYAWAALRPLAGSDLILFTARTTTSGDTVPGFGLPGLAPGVTLSPPSTPIIPGGPVWSGLGDDSGDCWDNGCGYTGWIGMDYTFDTAGTYSLVFGVTNWSDTGFDSGLAFDGIQVDDEPVDPTPAIPEPTTWAMMIAGFGIAGLAMRRRKVGVAFA